MHGTYVASFQQLRLDLQNEWNTQNWQPDHMCFDYLSRETSKKHWELKKDLERSNFESLSPTLIDYYLS